MESWIRIRAGKRGQGSHLQMVLETVMALQRRIPLAAVASGGAGGAPGGGPFMIHHLQYLRYLLRIFNQAFRVSL